MKTIIILLAVILTPLVLLSQDINGKLGTDGQFIIRDTNNTFISVPQSSGYLTLNRSLTLPNTTSSTLGIIFKGAFRFLHNYGSQNIFLGVNSGNFSMTGIGGNTIVGFSSFISNTTGYENTAVGSNALYSNSTGYLNTAFGTHSLNLSTTGYHNTAFGSYSLRSHTVGNQNTALGYASLYSNTSGSFNTAVGYQSLFNGTGGNQNTAVGYQSLYNTTGSYNTAIGYDAQVPNTAGSYQVRIGSHAITYAGVQVAWTITSDKRWKSNILNSNLGLNFISKLNPVSYSRTNDENQKTEYGFIAQEVEEILKGAGVENSGMLTIDDEGKYELRYNDLLAPMVKSMQELNMKCETLEEKNNNLEEKIIKLVQMQNILVNEIDKIKSNDTYIKEVKLGVK
ncbi:MAG: tail fiber domain-containing protein [Bacteroidota bacterium]|nr:tail fiber domain-containing protein [Bacteroidota bacterium]